MLYARLPVTVSLVLGLSLGAGAVVSAIAQDKSGTKPEAMTPEQKKEWDLRKDCKVKICSVFHNRKPDGGDIACGVIKTWNKDQIAKMIEKAKVSWPWGDVRCTADIKLKRADLIKAMTDDKFESQQAHLFCWAFSLDGSFIPSALGSPHSSEPA